MPKQQPGIDVLPNLKILYLYLDLIGEKRRAKIITQIGVLGNEICKSKSNCKKYYLKRKNR